MTNMCIAKSEEEVELSEFLDASINCEGVQNQMVMWVIKTDLTSGGDHGQLGLKFLQVSITSIKLSTFKCCRLQGQQVAP